jgi:hypothetical protein
MLWRSVGTTPDSVNRTISDPLRWPGPGWSTPGLAPPEREPGETAPGVPTWASWIEAVLAAWPAEPAGDGIDSAAEPTSTEIALPLRPLVVIAGEQLERAVGDQLDITRLGQGFAAQLTALLAELEARTLVTEFLHDGQLPRHDALLPAHDVELPRHDAAPPPTSDRPRRVTAANGDELHGRGWCWAANRPAGWCAVACECSAGRGYRR